MPPPRDDQLKMTQGVSQQDESETELFTCLVPSCAPARRFDNEGIRQSRILPPQTRRALGLEQSSGLLVDHLDALRQSVHGVSIDEEVTNLTAAQHAYNAAARVITTIDDMLDTLINRTGITR